jgi:hypothetical protein
MDLLDEFQHVQAGHAFDGRPVTPELPAIGDEGEDEDDGLMPPDDADGGGGDDADSALARLGRYTQPLALDATVRPSARGRGSVIAAAAGGGTLALATARGYVEWFRWGDSGGGGTFSGEEEERCADIEVVPVPPASSGEPASRVQRLFVDPTGTHLLALVRHGGSGAAAASTAAQNGNSGNNTDPAAAAAAATCELFYARRGWPRAKPIAKVRGHAVSAVAWPPAEGGADAAAAAAAAATTTTISSTATKSRGSGGSKHVVEESLTGLLVGTEAGSLHVLSLAVRTPAAALLTGVASSSSSSSSAAAIAAAFAAATVEVSTWHELLRFGDRHAACICSAEQVELPLLPSAASPPAAAAASSPSASSPPRRAPPPPPRRRRLVVFVCTPRALYAAVGGPDLDGVFAHLAAPGGEVAWDPVVQASVASLHSSLSLHCPRRFRWPPPTTTTTMLGGGGGAGAGGAAGRVAGAPPAFVARGGALLPTRFTWMVGGVLCHGHLQLPRLAADEGAVGAEGAAEAFCGARQLALAEGGLLLPPGGVGGEQQQQQQRQEQQYLPGGVYLGGAVAAAEAAAAAAAAAAAGGAGVAAAAAAELVAGGGGGSGGAEEAPLPSASSPSSADDRPRALLGGLAVPASAAAAAAGGGGGVVTTATAAAAGPEHEPVALAVTEYHYLLLYADRLVAVNQVSGRAVAEAKARSPAPLALVRDPAGGGRSGLGGAGGSSALEGGDACGTAWLVSPDAAAEALLPGEGRRMWRVYAAAGDHETALRLAVGARQRDAVRLAAASAAYRRGDYLSAASHWGRVSAPEPRFEDLALRLVDAGDAEALAAFLAARLDALSPQEDRAQAAMLGAWLTELYLDATNREAAEMEQQQAVTGMVMAGGGGGGGGGSSGGGGAGGLPEPERAGGELPPAGGRGGGAGGGAAARRLRGFLERRSALLDPATTAALLAGYGRADDLAAFCAARGDHEALLELLTAGGGGGWGGGSGGDGDRSSSSSSSSARRAAAAARALAVLRDPRVPQELVYRFAPALVAAAPRETVDSWIAARPPLDPRRLLPALVRFGGAGGGGGGGAGRGDEAEEQCARHVLRYLLHATGELGCEDQAVHNLAVALLAASAAAAAGVAAALPPGRSAAAAVGIVAAATAVGDDISPPGTPKAGAAAASSSSSPAARAARSPGNNAIASAHNAAALAAERPLLEFLRRARCRRTGRPLYDPRYALRVARERGRTRATVALLCELGLYDDAVALALASASSSSSWAAGEDEAVALAKAAASAPPADDAPLRRRLWLTIARHVVAAPVGGGVDQQQQQDTEQAQAERVARAAELVREASEAGATAGAAGGDGGGGALLGLIGGGGGGSSGRPLFFGGRGGGGYEGGGGGEGVVDGGEDLDASSLLLTAAAAAAAPSPAQAAAPPPPPPPPPLTVEDLLPLFPPFAAIGAFRAPIADALARYSRQIAALRREMDEATEIAERARRDLAALSGGRAAVLPAAAPCAKCGRPAAAAPAPNAHGLAPLSAGSGSAAVARLFYVFPTGLAWHALCAAEEVCALGGERRARRVAGLVARLAGAMAAGGGASSSGEARDRERRRLAAELAEEVACEDPWNGDLVAAMAEQPFVETGEPEEAAWAL